MAISSIPPVAALAGFAATDRPLVPVRTEFQFVPSFLQTPFSVEIHRAFGPTKKPSMMSDPRQFLFLVTKISQLTPSCRAIPPFVPTQIWPPKTARAVIWSLGSPSFAVKVVTLGA